jgi:serine/threonine protein kinase
VGSSDGSARRLGDFVLEDEVGRGGMGIVYRARQVSMGGRVVALKVLPSLIGVDRSSVVRFRREAEAAGRLAHPGIVPVYAVGEQDGVHFFAMEFVEGPSLEALLDAVAERTPERLLGSIQEESGFDQVFPRLVDSGARSSLSGGARYARSCARIAAEVAAALTVAHRSGVIHRDLKPSNVLLRASGQPVLVDFGLARDETMLGLTQSGDAIGTPSYMAPEQACGQRQCDGRTDVYGLGATLYQMLTLRPPFSGAHPGEIMRRIVEDEVVPVRSVNPRVPEDLARIVSCCLQKDLEARYASIEALELDLRNFLDGRPVIARNPGPVSRLLRAVARQSRSVAAGAAVLLATSLAFVGAGVVSARADREAGLEALEHAGRLLRDGDYEKAEGAFGRAHALLGADAVLDARRRHFRDEPLRLEGAGRPEELRQYLGLDWSQPLRGEGWWGDLLDRVEGRGRLQFDGLPDAAEVELRRVGDDGRIEDQRRAWEPELALPLGRWLVEVRAAGRAPVVLCAVVERDRDTALTPLLLSDRQVAAGEVLVVDPATGGGSLVRRDETSAGEFAAGVASIAHLELRRELLAERSAAADPAAPAIGLSWRTARAFAVAIEAHVPSYAEYLRAATGGIEGLPHPFGPDFDWTQVLASPTGEFAAPGPVGRAQRTATSPLGVRDLVGNAADLVAPEPGGLPSAVGGSFRDDDPRRLRVDSRDLLDSGVPAAVVGLRTARFVPPPDDPLARQALDELLGQMREELERATIHEWHLRRDGTIDWQLSLTTPSQQASTDRGFRLPLATPGFRLGPVEIGDAHDRNIRAAVVRDEVDYRELDLELPLRRGAPVRLRARARLEPRQALFAHGAHHALRLPLKAAAGVRALQVLRLPAGTRVDAVEPAPAHRFHVDGAPVLAWEVRADSAVRNAEVLFRIDGSLATPWPAFGEGERAFAALAAGLAAADPAERRDALDRLLAPDFALAPHGLGRDALLGAAPAAERFVPRAVEDVTAVARTVSVFARVDWVGPAGRTVRDWPVHALFERDGGRLRAVALGPRIDVDGGSLAGGRYRHADLGLALAIPEHLQAQREAAGPWELQLHLHEARPEDGAAWVDIRGFRAPRQPEIGAVEALDRLTAGAAMFAEAGQVAVERAEWDSPRPDLRSRCFRGLRFAGAGERLETWHLVERGYRWFLARVVVVGDPAGLAAELERAESRLLGPILAGLEVAAGAEGPETGSGPR